MPTAWQTVPVFISSTFRDMHAERDYLVRVVFPALREKLLPYRIHLDDSDLRWGVTREQADQHGALDVCLKQIERPNTFFIGVLGQYYGHVPEGFSGNAGSKYGWIKDYVGRSITELEIRAVLRNSEMHARALFFFRKLESIANVPEALRSHVEEKVEPEVTTREDSRRSKLERLKGEIRSARPTASLVQDYRCRFAGLRINWRMARLELSVDDVRVLESVAADGMLTANEYQRLDERLRKIVDELGVVYMDRLEEFGRAVHDGLWKAIQAEYNLPDAPAAPREGERDELAEELDYHRRFIESRFRVYVGREGIQQALTAFADGDQNMPCLLTGRSGSGKSAALATFVTKYEEYHDRVLVIPHFVGASPASTNLRQMLRRFCLILQREFEFTDAAKEEGQESGEILADVPQTVNELIPRFRDFIGRVPDDRRVMFVIDALNQLDEADNAHSMYWLPQELPAHVKITASCVADPDRQEQVLEAFEHRPRHLVEIGDLTEEERRGIVRDVPSLSAKALDDLQVAMLLDNPATGNPLFLLVALEELRGFGSFARLDLRVASLPWPHEASPPRADQWPGIVEEAVQADEQKRKRWARWADAVGKSERVNDPISAVFDQVVDRLRDDFDGDVAESVLTLLASARRGLSDRELLELTEGVGTGIEDSTTDLFPVLRQLRPYLLQRAELVDFYHLHLEQAVRERYLSTEESRADAHARLAEYFQRQDYFLEDLEVQRARAKRLPPTPRPVNIRKVDELPWQLLEVAKLLGKDDPNSEHWDVVADLLTDWQFLEAKAEAQP